MEKYFEAQICVLFPTLHEDLASGIYEDHFSTKLSQGCPLCTIRMSTLASAICIATAFASTCGPFRVRINGLRVEMQLL